MCGFFELLVFARAADSDDGTKQSAASRLFLSLYTFVSDMLASRQKSTRRKHKHIEREKGSRNSQSRMFEFFIEVHVGIGSLKQAYNSSCARMYQQITGALSVEARTHRHVNMHAC